MSTLTSYSSPENKDYDRILATTERGRYFVLDYDAGENVLTTVCKGSVKDPIGSSPYNGPISLTLSTPHPLTLPHVYSGYLKVYPHTPTGSLNEENSWTARMDEPDGVIDMCALNENDPSKKPGLAVLYKDHRDRYFLKTYTIDASAKSLTPGPWDKHLVEAGSTHLISSPNMCQNGVLIVGRKSVTYHNGITTKAVPMMNNEMTCWGNVGDEGNR